MKKNKVHFQVEYDRAVPAKRFIYAACGVMFGARSHEKAPVSREWRDVDCKRCLRSKLRPKRKK